MGLTLPAHALSRARCASRGAGCEAFTLSFIRLFAARNPSTFEALYYTLFKRNLAERDRWLLTAKLIRR